jgi:TPR repeat protein
MKVYHFICLKSYTVSVEDLQKAVNWYQKAAENNNQWDAKDRVKQLNKQGYYTKEDEQEGILIDA